MGQYLQLGICHRLTVGKARMIKLELSDEKLLDELNKEMDMSLFDRYEDENEIHFVINESIVMQQILDFLQFQYSLYDQNEQYSKSFESALAMISQMSSLQEIVELAKEMIFPCFQNGRIFHEIMVNHWGSLRIDISIFVIFVEGKIFMEEYNLFLKYLENVVRGISKQWSIAGAFRCFIQ